MQRRNVCTIDDPATDQSRNEGGSFLPSTRTMCHCLATDKKNVGAPWHCFTANNPALQGVHLRDEIMKILMNRRRRVRYKLLYRAQRHFIANIFP